jgi:hypothetical protein
MNDKIDLKAFEEGRMDEFMRKTLEGYRVDPEPGLWKDISRKLFWRDIAHFNFTNFSTKSWMTVIAGLLIVAAGVYFSLTAVAPDISTAIPAGTNPVTGKNQSRTIPGTAVTNVAGTTARHAINVDVKSGKAGLSKPGTFNKTAAPVEPDPNKTVKPEPAAYALNLPVKKSGDLSGNPGTVNPETRPAPSANVAGKEEYAVRIKINPLIPFEATELNTGYDADSVITIRTSAGIMKFESEKPGPVQFFSSSLGVAPEMSFYDEQDHYSEVNVWINGLLTYNISRFSVSTGLGLGYVYDRGNYRVDYNSLDSVGYYSSVISFTTGPNNEIIYYTVNQSIYDSLPHSSDYRAMNRYTYLQIPLLLGYRLFETGSISLTFRAGPAVSFLLGTRKSDPEISYPEGRVVRVDDNTPSRIHTNWQVWTDLNLEIRMNKKISLYVEPSFKYYLKPVVEQENVRYKAPWSIGLGAGIQFNFGQTKE